MKRYQSAILLVTALIIGASLQAQSNNWTNLFDGKTLKGWMRLAGTAEYSVKDGMIVGTTVANSGNTFLATQKQYGDFVLELDIKIESDNGNSGVQTRSHYNPAGHNGKGLVYGRQVEVDPSDRKWSGGIYDEGRRQWLYPLTLNAKAQDAFKKNEFNHYKIECIGNEMKTWVNGIPAAYLVDTIDEKGFIALQVHQVKNEGEAGKNIYFKNIRVKTGGLKPTPFPSGIFVVDYVPNHLTQYERKDGWNLLFDGKTSNGWRGAYLKTFPTKDWVVRNGTITVLQSEGKEGGDGGDIVTEGEYKAFDLSFEFRLTPGANSGVKYFVTLDEHNTASAIGLEYQVLDDSLHPDAKLGRDGDRTLASLYDLIPSNKPKSTIRPIGEWNTGRVVVYPNNHVEHYLNGIKVLEYERGSKEFRDLVAISKYVKWNNFGEAPQGHLLLQDHGNTVSFRSIKVKRLD